MYDKIIFKYIYAQIRKTIVIFYPYNLVSKLIYNNIEKINS